MRLLVVSQATDLHALRKTLFTSAQPAATMAAALGRVEALNPHVDLQHIAAGTVLLLPDLPSVSPVHSRSIGGDAFAGLVADATNGLKAAAQRLRAGADEISADRSAVKAVLRLAGVKRIVDSDRTIAKQLDAATARSAADQKHAEEALAMLETLATQVGEDLAALAKLFG
jgi:hypothetical protein